MIDPELLRKDFNDVAKRIRTRNRPYQQLDDFAKVDQEWRTLVSQIQALNTKRNALSAQITQLIKTNPKQAEQLKNDVVKIKHELEDLTKNETVVHQRWYETLCAIPNIPDPDVPIGADENDNVELRKVNKPKQLTFKPLPHWELAEKLEIADFVRGVKIGGSRHTVFVGDGARLMRALRDFTLDMHRKAGYLELLPPILINADVLYGTGHLPKSREDMFELTNGQFLSPTEEVPLVGAYANEKLDEKTLPLKLTSSTVSFRSEAGTAGKDMRGVIRQHQFYNTEMVIYCLPKDSEKQLELMTAECEAVLKALKLPYRVIALCTGDMGSAAVKTYDVEVWFPCNNKYREISSCSNCREYQARGSHIKYLNTKTKQADFVHTLNGTGTSLNRLWIAVVENYQTKSGTINIPLALQKYMDGQKVIRKPKH